MPLEKVTACVKQAFNFPLVVRPIEENIASLELYHGPTLAFKDFGGRFMAQILLADLWHKYWHKLPVTNPLLF
ncbi:Threonine synthase [Arsenophonus endosymbiont of Bemisia tabaci Q2]|nr:Threonine synthase [Arsenophonus endosymbiont of Bemisia tabaci Q2]